MQFWQAVTSWYGGAILWFSMVVVGFWWFFLPLLLTVLSLPPAIEKQSWKDFFIALPKVALGVLLPIPIFALSAFLVPEWKGACRCGWIDCFYMGKTALMPIVFWSTAALYVNDILGMGRRRPWIVLGIFMGAITSTALLIYGIAVSGSGSILNASRWFLLVPFYVAVWYSFRAIQLVRGSSLRPVTYLYTLLASIPFWFAGIVWSMRLYQDLPDKPPDCFVVTAACRGHEGIVGPFVVVQRGGRARRANQQLLTFWRFEALWDAHSPRSHRLFRRCYNAWGPHLARLVRNRWLADLAYLLLKPLELLAHLLTVAFAHERSAELR